MAGGIASSALVSGKPAMSLDSKHFKRLDKGFEAGVWSERLECRLLLGAYQPVPLLAILTIALFRMVAGLVKGPYV